ncbi:hypothetical protein B0H14DRAFT_3510965 [Mycena olivaceomarginata]|nr:hypothetical protein B0H14DRAFT_3510965 [Mycena olivaceomarginata]
MPPLRSTPSSPTLPPASRSPPPPTPPPADFQRGERQCRRIRSHAAPALHAVVPDAAAVNANRYPAPRPHQHRLSLISSSVSGMSTYQWSFPFHSRWVCRALEEQLATPKRHSSMFSSAHSEALICLIHALLNLTHPLPSHLLPSSTNALVFQ